MLAAILNTFANCFKIPELKSRIFFTLLVLAICRLVAVIPVPGLDGAALAEFFEQNASRRAGSAGHVQHVHRRRAGALRGRRPGHHALHQRHDHHPVADRGHSAT